jgi:16S rRNA (uracil1498-N3)-methyltransferase
MNPPRVYHPEKLQVGRDVTLTAGASHHLARVLRLVPGDAVRLFDGSGGEYRGVVRSSARDSVRVRSESFDPVERESALRVGLAQVISSGERMEFTVRKAVELGVAWIQPLTARRSIVRLTGERAARRVEHWQRIVISACEQCGRNRVPTVRPIVDLLHWLGDSPRTAVRLILEPASERSMSQIEAPAGEVTLLAGGESGFAPEDTEAAVLRGFVPVRLGPRVLRTETAGMAALAAMQALWGDM